MYGSHDVSSASRLNHYFPYRLLLGRHLQGRFLLMLLLLLPPPPPPASASLPLWRRPRFRIASVPPPKTGSRGRAEEKFRGGQRGERSGVKGSSPLPDSCLFLKLSPIGLLGQHFLSAESRHPFQFSGFYF